SPRHKSHDPPLDAKTNPYFLSPIHPKITKTPSKHTSKNGVIKEREQSDQSLAQIDQLRRQEHEVSECMMVHTSKNDAHQKETSQIERISSLPEKPNPGSFTIPCSVDIFNINGIADLGASVNIMSKSILEELSLADPKNANIIVEMADKTRCVSQGIIENVLVKIDKFSFTSDFVIIDTKGSNNKTIILGRPFLANTRAEINVSTIEVSLGIKEDMEKIKMNKQECNFTIAVSEHLNERPTSRDKLSYGAGNTNSKTYWCEPVRQEHEKGYILWASCDPYHEICDGGGIPDKKLKHYWKSTNDDDRIGVEWEGLSCTNWDNKLGGQTQEKTIMEEHDDPEKCGESKTRAIIGAMINKLPEEWFSGVSKDKDDLEGIIDYLEPTLYDGFNDHNDEAYKQRRNKLLGMPYTEPPSIVKEEAEITRYNLGAGDKPMENKEYWESSNDDKRIDLEWENLSFDNWVKVAFGKETDIQEKDKNKAKNDKTKHENEKSVSKNRSQRQSKSKKSQPRQSQSQLREAE
ncbi:RNA-directed DNA polymerase, eukaryota, reverse transcriptase zinc-binding domain protein, partial [Tanacetum coccineum]